MSNKNYEIEGQWFAVSECCVCSMRWLQPSSFEKRARDEGRRLTMYCPAGHAQSYAASRLDEVRKERDALRDSLAAAEARADRAEAAIAAAKKRKVARQ